jgi:hypothetical protein
LKKQAAMQSVLEAQSDEKGREWNLDRVVDACVLRCGAQAFCAISSSGQQ